MRLELYDYLLEYLLYGWNYKNFDDKLLRVSITPQKSSREYAY